MIARVAAIAVSLVIASESIATDDVVVRRVPQGGYKSSVTTDATGRIHLSYFTGEPTGGDAWYVTSADGAKTFSKPLRVNSQPGSVLGASSARGPRIALGKGGRVHAIWMGSSKATPRGQLNPAMPADSPFNGIPLLYSQLDPATEAFTPQRNLMSRTVALDGDSAVLADSNGKVQVVWHAALPGGKSEKDRDVWIAESTDGGATFSEERNILPEPTGVCPCCALTAQVAPDGTMMILYRAATDTVNRGMRLLRSEDGGKTFKLSALDEWKLAMCPMSTASAISTSRGFLGAWENDGKLGFGRLSGDPSEQLSGKTPRKHPTLASNDKGETLLAWAEGIAFGKGGAVGWQRFDAAGKPVGPTGHAEGLPGHGSIAAVALNDGTFAVIY
jgi:hypothetical protein